MKDIEVSLGMGQVHITQSHPRHELVTITLDPEQANVVARWITECAAVALPITNGPTGRLAFDAVDEVRVERNDSLNQLIISQEPKYGKKSVIHIPLPLVHLLRDAIDVEVGLGNDR